MKSICVIAGFDPSGGAGIHADIKTARALGFHACSVVTGITFQNTCEIKGILVVSGEDIKNQFEAIIEDVDISAIKIGMVTTSEQAEEIAYLINNVNRRIPIVLDPVVESSSGYNLGSLEGYNKIIEMSNEIIITPNRQEAEELYGVKVQNLMDFIKLKGVIRCSVVVTGSMETDFVYDGKKKEFFKVGGKIKIKSLQRGKNKAGIGGDIHGTGCVYSTALACFLAEGLDLLSAARKARRFTVKAARNGKKIGKCRPVVNL